MVVCHCRAINDSAIRELIRSSQLTAGDIADICGAGADCGGCLHTIEDLLDVAPATEAGRPLPGTCRQPAW